MYNTILYALRNILNIPCKQICRIYFTLASFSASFLSASPKFSLKGLYNVVLR